MKTKRLKALSIIIIVKKGSGIGDAMLGCSYGAYPWELLNHSNTRAKTKS